MPSQLRQLCTTLEPQLSRVSKRLGGNIAVIILTLALAVEVGRLTVASAVVDRRPKLAATLAPAAPATLAATSMQEVGQAAAKAGQPSRSTLNSLRELSAISPLSPEPFLVQAALAERSGDYTRAEQLLLAARLRSPRSVAARYLLADVYFREGKVAQSVREIAILSRLNPQLGLSLVPALSQYAQTPGAKDVLSGIIAENPQLKQPLLDALSADPDNASLVMGLAGADGRAADPVTQSWKARLLSGLIARGELARAYGIWRDFAGFREAPPDLLFNGAFRRLAAPPPFNWHTSNSSAGLAELRDGTLRVVYYGRVNTVLASQLLLLQPGSYRLEAPVAGQVAPGALVWSLTCRTGNSALAQLRLDSGSRAVSFTVPPSGCAAQWLELKGVGEDMPQETDVQIGPARIERVSR